MEMWYPCVLHLVYTIVCIQGMLFSGWFIWWFRKQVVEVSTSKTGKHGHAKCHFVGIDIFNGKKLEDIVPSSHNCDVSFYSFSKSIFAVISKYLISLCYEMLALIRRLWYDDITGSSCYSYWLSADWHFWRWFCEWLFFPFTCQTFQLAVSWLLDDVWRYLCLPGEPFDWQRKHEGWS